MKDSNPSIFLNNGHIKSTPATEIITRYTLDEYERAGSESLKYGPIRWGACGCSLCRLRTLEGMFGKRTTEEDGIIYG